ncbi:hypothetical protein ANN_19973 [Periplaneta americana]|uniref:Cell cycle checkpoint protein RAD17 n=1 Tax=Periplaneta americana TaxID=6978 RepID=A0ABQ8SCF4_PERAM|nr:hypothetical protein ANN_19973 [Periplaneta americana]
MAEDWLQLYTPRKLQDLNIQKTKITELQLWLKHAFEANNVPSILILRGPPGSGKTTAVHLTASLQDTTIIEWITPVDINSDEDKESWIHPESQVHKFERFLFNTGRYQSILQHENNGKRLILIKDYPNVFLLNPVKLHDIIINYVAWGRTPIVFLCSEQQSEKGLFPISFLKGLSIPQITLNKATTNSILSALKRVSSLNHLISQEEFPKQILCQIVKNANGDIKNAVIQLQYEFTSRRHKISGREFNIVGDSPLSLCKLPVLTKEHVCRPVTNVSTVKTAEADRPTCWNQFVDFNIFGSKTKIPSELKRICTKGKTLTAKKSKARKVPVSRPDKKQVIAEDNIEQSEISKVCGKDLRLPIFQNVGRILYPKLCNQISLEKNHFKADQSKEKFIYNPEEIVEQTLGHHETVIQMTFENYLKTFRDIQDISHVIKYVSDGDIVLMEFRERELGLRIAMSAIVRGFMLCNRDIIRKWNPLTTKEFSTTTKEWLNLRIS